MNILTVNSRDQADKLGKLFEDDPIWIFDLKEEWDLKQMRKQMQAADSDVIIILIV